MNFRQISGAGHLELEEEESLLESLATPDLEFTSTWGNYCFIPFNKVFKNSGGNISFSLLHLVSDICQFGLVFPQSFVPFSEI